MYLAARPANWVWLLRGATRDWFGTFLSARGRHQWGSGEHKLALLLELLQLLLLSCDNIIYKEQTVVYYTN